MAPCLHAEPTTWTAVLRLRDRRLVAESVHRLEGVLGMGFRDCRDRGFGLVTTIYTIFVVTRNDANQN